MVVGRGTGIGSPITVTSLLSSLAVYTVRAEGSTAAPTGLFPTATVAVTVLVVPSMTETELAPRFAT